MASASDASDSANKDNIAEQLKKIAEKMEQEIRDGAIELESLGQQITIRIRENGSFAAGSAFLQPQFVPVVIKIGTALSDIPGEIEVSGHSDISNIANKLYRSNWDLSSQRAVAVGEQLVQAPNFDASRMIVVGMSNNRLLTEELTAQAQARNRRVEIMINQGRPKYSDPISVTQ